MSVEGIVFGLVVLLAIATVEAQSLKYPPTRKSNHVDVYHGTSVPDPYQWLENTESAETKAWIEAQNALTIPYLHSLLHREPLKRILTRRWNYPRYGIPFKRGRRYFHFKNDGLQNQAVLYWQPTLTGKPRVLLDPNLLSPDGTVSVSSVAVSEDGRWLAYGLSQAGSDWQQIKVRSVETGEDLPDDLCWVKFSSIAWTKDGKGFFYCRYPEPHEDASPMWHPNLNQKVYYHRLGTSQTADILILERPDKPEWRYSVTVSEDGRYAVIGVTEAGPKNLVYVIDLQRSGQPNVKAPVQPLIDTFEASYQFLGNDGTLFYFRTDLNAPRGRVIAIDLNHRDKQHWKTVSPEGEDTLQAVTLMGKQMAVVTLHNATSRVCIYTLKGEFVREIPLPTLGTCSGFVGRRSQEEFFYSFTSFVHPHTIYRYDVRTGASTVFHAPDIEGLDPAQYETKQVWFRSKDGTRVPMFIVHRKGIKRDGANPTLLYGYGGFNISLTPFFSVSYLVWLENGGILAVPNLRGGGEFGEEWHQAGTKEHKQNVFDDFIAAAEYLINHRYTSPQKLAIRGGSNGGLLVGAVICQRPELFGVALPAVGVMDMLRYHRFTIGSAWKEDYGTSDDPQMFRVLFAYSPYHNLKPGVRYPATLVTTGDHDDRVMPAHSFKFTARLQEVQAGPEPVLIRIQTRTGHGAGKPTSLIIEEEADVMAFTMYHLGMEVPKE
ncbi:MAG: prolyl oligopeptidase family serine peptidase [Armatimonadota bacterium]